jgi:thymidylate synthase
VDSFHIYGSYFKEFEGFLGTVKNRKFEDRVWETKFAEPFFEEARDKLKAEA